MDAGKVKAEDGAAAMRCLSIAHVHTVVVGGGGDRVSELEARFAAKQGHRVTIVGDTAPAIVARLAADGVSVVPDHHDERQVERVLARTGHLDVVHCHCILSAPFAAALARASGAVFVVHIHSMGEDWWEGTGLFASLHPRRRRLRRRIDKAFASAQLVLCVSEAVREHMTAIRLPIRRVEFLPNPIDAVFFREDIAEGSDYDVAVVARPSRAKSPLTALRILAQARRMRPGLRMIWIGPLGRWATVLRSAARVLRLGNLRFTGGLPPELVCDLLDRTRLLLSASNREGQPLSVLEALARRCSVLLSDIPSHRQFLAHPGVRLFRLRKRADAARMLVELLEEHDRPPRPVLIEHRVEAHGQRVLRHYWSLLGGSDNENQDLPQD
jgi:glycosyltransferase involved in cell wall biosynthesis